MKEYVSNIEPEVYDEICYPQIVMGHMVGQKTLDGNLLLYASPEKYPLIEPDQVVDPPKQQSRPQGVLNLEFYPSNQPYESYAHPQRPRGNRR